MLLPNYGDLGPCAPIWGPDPNPIARVVFRSKIRDFSAIFDLMWSRWMAYNGLFTTTCMQVHLLYPSRWGKFTVLGLFCAGWPNFAVTRQKRACGCTKKPQRTQQPTTTLDNQAKPPTPPSGSIRACRASACELTIPGVLHVMKR